MAHPVLKHSCINSAMNKNLAVSSHMFDNSCFVCWGNTLCCIHKTNKKWQYKTSLTMISVTVISDHLDSMYRTRNPSLIIWNYQRIKLSSRWSGLYVVLRGVRPCTRIVLLRPAWLSGFSSPAPNQESVTGADGKDISVQAHFLQLRFKGGKYFQKIYIWDMQNNWTFSAI